MLIEVRTGIDYLLFSGQMLRELSIPAILAEPMMRKQVRIIFRLVVFEKCASLMFLNFRG